MITIANTHVQTQITISPEHPVLLIIENPREYWNFVCELQKALDGEQSEFSFWENTDQLQPSKSGEMLSNLFSFDFAERKIVSLLYKKLQSNYQSGEYILGFNTINAQVGEFLQTLFQTIDFQLSYSEFTLENLLKSCEVKPEKTYQSLLEKLICYINIFVELKNTRFFVFIGIKDVLSDEELTSLYHHCTLQKVGLLLVESFKKRNLLPVEKAVTITEDLCEIVENFDDM